ncbi:MAG TPA: c-type cytochrome [Burkholderiales bacterium]|nr:c-type cytochrome [Burkholderiales bacterium]
MLPKWKGRWALLTVLFSFACFSQDRIQSCADCHGEDGNSTDPQIPSIAGQPKLFLENQLILYREEVRKSSEMLPVVKGLKDSEIIKLAEHFSKLPAKGMESGTPETRLLQRGSQRAKELRCGICHLADFRGQNQIPRLAGQREVYLAAEMRAYRDSKRTGGDTIMAAALYGVGDSDIKALAHFLSRSTARSPGR